MQQNYFAYFPQTGVGKQWGLEVTSAGYTRVPPGQPYPLVQHPADHHFTWARGRVLDAHQCIFISEGEGTFESSATRRLQHVRAGQFMLLFPGVWHRYAPDPRHGWIEHWIECRGPLVDGMRRRGQLRADLPIKSVADVTHLLQCFATIHQWAHTQHGERRVELATLAAHLYSLVRADAAPATVVDRHIDDLVRQAQLWMAEHAHEPFHVGNLSRRLGVASSYFRRAFRRRVGIPPKRYHIHLRLRKAQELLANTPLSITQIAQALGFDTPYHLSQQFKHATGTAPSHWRRALQRR